MCVCVCVCVCACVCVYEREREKIYHSVTTSFLMKTTVQKRLKNSPLQKNFIEAERKRPKLSGVKLKDSIKEILERIELGSILFDTTQYIAFHVRTVSHTKVIVISQWHPPLK